MAKARICTIRAPGSRAIAAQEEALDFAFEFRQGRRESLQPRIDDDGPLRIQPIQSEAHGLPEPPLDAIAYHRRAERPRDGEADAGARAYAPALQSFAYAKGRK